MTPSDSPSLLRFLAESSQELNSSLRLDEVFRLIARRVYQLVDSHLFCIMLFDEERAVLEHSYSLKFGELIEQEGSFPLSYGISGAAGAARKPVRVDDVTRDGRYVRFRHAEVDIRSELAIPLLLQNRLIGVLDLESTEVATFTEEHEQVLVALGSHIATALENARLYERVRRQQKRMDEDLATARRIQRALLPQTVPRMEGLEIASAFAPARELAGDFYDFLPYADGRLAIAVGDVAGKATPAALYGGLAVGSMRGRLVQNACSPTEMMLHLNEQLYALPLDNRFLALIYALVDPAARSMTVANAGLPWLRRIREGFVERLEVAGLPLGAFERTECEQIQLELVSGDVYVFCSDGLEEGLDQQLEPSGGERLDRWLERLAERNPQTIADELLLASRGSFDGHVEAHDDRSVVVLRVLDEGEMPPAG